MASIIDSFKEVFSDRFSFFKLVVFTLPVYYSYQAFLQSKQDFTLFFEILGVTLFFLLGFLIETTGNLINERTYVLPSLNPLKIAFTAIKGIVALGPVCYVLYLAVNYIFTLIPVIPWVDIAIKYIIGLLAVAIILISFVMFAARENILDTFNVKIIFKKAGDLIVLIYFFMIQLIVINLLIGGFIGYALSLLFGPGFILDFFIMYLIVFNLAVAAHYLGQINFEVIGCKKNDINY